MNFFYNYISYLVIIIITALLTYYFTKKSNYEIDSFESYLSVYELDLNKIIEKYKNENLNLVSQLEKKTDLGWSKTEEASIMSECIESKMSVGYCECIVNIFKQEFENLDDFNKKFDSISEFLLLSIISGNNIQGSQNINFLEKISQCD